MLAFVQDAINSFKFPTSTKTTGTSGGQYWTCNLAAVWGQMVTGNEYAPLSESMSVMGISTMTKAAFISAGTVVGIHEDSR